MSTIPEPGKLEKEETVSETMLHFWYNGIDEKTLATAVESMFIKEGYKLEEGTINEGKYGRGSASMRLILGGFIERHKFSVKITKEDALTRLQFSPGMTGLSGGLWGKSHMNNEFHRIAEKFK